MPVATGLSQEGRARLNRHFESLHRICPKLTHFKKEGFPYGAFPQSSLGVCPGVQAASHNGLEGMTAKTWVGQYSGQFGANLLNDLNLNYVTEDTPRADEGLDLPEIQVASPSVTYGEVAFLPITSTNDRKEVADTLSYLLDKHVIKAGIDYNDTSIDQVFKGTGAASTSSPTTPTCSPAAGASTGSPAASTA